ncbi:hypothetical protein AV545_03135 [Paenibacillus jamilae]|uniref:hypothetical protein n=1 Tax=Paenibacillus jamilae TaxID=114136 RepID=UPI0007AB2520|nr:hypothetical protein [Paenibacillus jamilae]KZE66635.1 hypothetical protein AV545_03135 [Paenibacillus jamilae]
MKLFQLSILYPLYTDENQAYYEEYLGIADPDDIIPTERWSFIGKNFRSDSTEELSYLNSPVLLVLAGKDINVDVKNTEQVYRKKIPSELLSVIHIPEATIL